MTRRQFLAYLASAVVMVKLPIQPVSPTSPLSTIQQQLAEFARELGRACDGMPPIIEALDKGITVAIDIRRSLTKTGYTGHGVNVCWYDDDSKEWTVLN